MNTLPHDIKINLIYKYYLNDADALNLYKSCKLDYSKIRLYKYKGAVDYYTLHNYKNCVVNKIYNVSVKYQLQLLPKSIMHLTFGVYFNQRVSRANLPNSITHLTFGDYFNRSILNLPNSITHLTFGHTFNHPIFTDTLPKFITYLKFGDIFNQPINTDNLPNSITHLTLGYNFSHLVDNLPQSIVCLTRIQIQRQESKGWQGPVGNHGLVGLSGPQGNRGCTGPRPAGNRRQNNNSGLHDRISKKSYYRITKFPKASTKSRHLGR